MARYSQCAQDTVKRAMNNEKGTLKTDSGKEAIGNLSYLDRLETHRDCLPDSLLALLL